jgi:hypothetical protein
MMSRFLQEELGVAMSGVKWDIDGFKLWQSTDPNIILFTPRQPTLAINPANGRYQVAVSQFRQQTEGTYKVTHGSAIFTITSAIQYDAREFARLKEQWLAEMGAVGPEPPRNPRFIPLNVQKGKAQVLINPLSGTPNEAHNEADVGTPGGTNSFLVELTELGAQEWVQGIKTKSNIPAGVKFMYEYLRMMPHCGARVTLHGRRAFQHISGELNVSYDGLFYGGSAQIEAMWERMTRNGVVEVTIIGQLPPELEEIRQELVGTFADEARDRMFNALFEPKPDVEPAQAGDTSGIFGGANFAFKYRREEEVIDLTENVWFEGWTWLKSSMDADLTTLFASLDDSYITEVNAQMSFPASVVVDADPQLEDVAVSWSASEGKAPEAPVFGSEGGNTTYVVTSQNPDNVLIRYRAKVNFAPASWPVIEDSGEQTVAAGGNQVVVKASAWIGRHMIYMYIREGNEISFDLNPNDHLICNVSYEGAHLTRAITASAKITPFEPLEFSYPLSPTGQRGTAKFSAFGVIGGRMVRARDVEINFDEEAVFILASRDEIQLVSENSLFPESDVLRNRLKKNKDRPAGETIQPEPPTPEKGTVGVPQDGAVTGTVIGVEYGSSPALVIESESGEHMRVPVHSADELDPFDDTRKHVRVELAKGYAKRISVILH